MADTKLSALSAAAALDGTELVEVVQGGSNKKVALSLASPLLRATGVKTTAYSAVIWDEVPVDTTGGTFAVTLPTAPLDGSEIVVKWTAGTAAPTVVTSGADVLNVAAGSTTATFSALNQVLTFRYKSTGAIWYVETGFSKGGLDTLYAPLATSAMVVLAETVAGVGGVATIDFTSIPATYRNLLIEGQVRTDVAAAFDLVVARFNNDTSSIYDSQRISASTTTVSTTQSTAAAYVEVALVPGGSATAASAGAFSMRIPNYAGTTFRKAYTSQWGDSETDASGGHRSGSNGGEWRSTAAISRVTFWLGGASVFVAGSTVTLYGVKGLS